MNDSPVTSNDVVVTLLLPNTFVATTVTTYSPAAAGENISRQ